jgi:hypothetical protein
VFLLDEGASAVLLLRALGHRSGLFIAGQHNEVQRSPVSPATGYWIQARSLRREQAAGFRVIDNGDRHLQLFRLTSCHVCGWKCARRRSPWNGQHSGRLAIDDQLKLGRLCDRQVHGFGALQDATGLLDRIFGSDRA